MNAQHVFTIDKRFGSNRTRTPHICVYFSEVQPTRFRIKLALVDMRVSNAQVASDFWPAVRTSRAQQAFDFLEAK